MESSIQHRRDVISEGFFDKISLWPFLIAVYISRSLILSVPKVGKLAIRLFHGPKLGFGYPCML